ncbi:MAG: glycosyltransferase family A protein [Ginsengibacter sp.]
MYSSKNILIGIYCPPFATTSDLINTINTIQLSVGSLNLRIIVLADNSKGININKIEYDHVIANDVYKGKAFCFNQLITYEGAHFFAFIEAGLLLGPHCLSLLTSALERSEEFGLAGPSTNRCWNEQASLPQPYRSFNYREISEITKEVFKEEFRELIPLHSLSDFCYIVKGEVIETIGCADEAYGLGSCWEMDFNVRASRSGFKGMWIKGAFAERTLNWPYEDMLFNKQLYQNRFCALQQKSGVEYRQHCLGDSCNNFALTQFAKLKINSVIDRKKLWQKDFSTHVPLISCIMPTTKRPEFFRQAIKFFEQQDYPKKELIVVYNQDSDIPESTVLPSNVSLIKSHAISIGEKRNEGCDNANGSIVAQWDDDDIYAYNRLSCQVSPILEGECEITGLNNFTFYEIATNKYWICSEELFKTLFVENVASGTLVFLKSIWQNYAVYPSISLREDSEFLVAAIKKAARLKRINGKNLFSYCRHSHNTWRFNAGAHVNKNEWTVYSSEPVAVLEMKHRFC